MKMPLKIRKLWRSTSGSVMVFGLLIVTVGAVVLAGWAHSLASRTFNAEEALTAHQRRIAERNARYLAEQWVLLGHASNTVTTNSVSITVGGTNWGGFTVSAGASNTLTTTNFLTNLVGGFTQTNRNAFSPLGNGGFVTNVDVQLTQSFRGTDGVSRSATNTRRYLLRSRSPLYGGYPLVAHTGADDFEWVTVNTNDGGSTLMYSTPASLTNAPTSQTYSANSFRFVAENDSRTLQASPNSFPAIPMTSGDGSYSGSLSSPVPRSENLNDIAAALATVLPTNAPAVAQLAPIPEAAFFGSERPLRQLGTTPSGKHIAQLSFGESLPILVVGDSPTTAPVQTNEDEITLTHYGQQFRIRYDDGNMEYFNGSEWTGEISPADEYYTLNSDGTVEDNSMPSTYSSTTVNISARTVVIPARPEDIIMVRNNTLTVGDIAGPGQFSTSAGAAIYHSDEMGVSGGVSFFLVPSDPTATLAIQSALEPADFMVRGTVDSYQLIQFDIDSDYEIEDPRNANHALILIDPSRGARMITLPSEPSSADSLLMHVSGESVSVTNSTETLSLRKWLFVLDPTSELTPTLSSSAVAIAFLDPWDIELEMEDGDSGRALSFTILGDGSTIDLHEGGDGTTWNLSMTVVNGALELDPPQGSGMTFVGGFRVNGAMYETDDERLSLELNTNPGNLELLSDRMGWVESWQR